MKYIGRFGEHLVLSLLLSEGLEAYPAIKMNQDDYDITVILEDLRVVRIQVKSTEIDNDATNNPVGDIDLAYDVLVVVVVDADRKPRFFVLSRADALRLQATSKQLYTTRRLNGKYVVRDTLLPFEGKWETISS